MKIRVKIIIQWLFVFILWGSQYGCKKYLSEKSNQSLVIPSTLTDLQSLLDNYLQVNQKDPVAGQISCDDFYLLDNDYNTLGENERNIYTWAKDNLFADGIDNDWARCYTQVGRANQVLSQIDNISYSTNEIPDWENTRGQALFLRGRAFLFAISLWGQAFDTKTAATDLGIPLRLDPEFNTRSVRSSVAQSYDQVVSDLKESIRYLPVNAVHPIRPCKAAAMALLARTYLWMRNYDSCLNYADACLQLRSELKDYNELDVNATYPFSAIRYTNPEDLANFIMYGPPASLSISKAKIDSMLYKSYDDNDLRKKIYFRANTGTNAGSFGFKGSYFGNSVPYDGVALDEVYLMRAECYVRTGNLNGALEDLNNLMSKRWRRNTFIPFTTSIAKDALIIILKERRKELVFRGLRWMDIKRLNKENADISLVRQVNNSAFTLLPNDKRFALPIPKDVISLSGMVQNER
ncbi:RagB/SusD family nutrient uptake outer membrane protein [Niabella beijingensis]|uniref:RagB/SusD family nutrient uptake outer membrane protein n=1 Tax=Niabella beijingensis TaxID=2872700 RepID=UPI001CC145D0|nr:RagB/SusD family nutrient uptake outer membrane protein [Niabella beijingensis]MBZ4190565.1 RagB/SusD family nutrient uptake outer membrane protein [Niabella beijingensis]